MISVCMTTYNGQDFIGKQIESILRQLAIEDELIICDDGSQDETIKIINSFGDERISLHINTNNLGHVKNFEKSIALSKGDLIFLSDQDDIWLSGKIDKIKREFESNPNITLVHHGISTIDANDKLICNDYFNPNMDLNLPKYRALLSLTLFPKFFGCAIAFRRELLKIALPFPKTVYAHDHYLCSAGLIHGDVSIVSDNLILYRQHNNNLTPRLSRLTFRSIINRFKLFSLNFILFFRRFNV